jgi:murein DD-endopeptidase MepM/ murein hydrolase activator NlpD
MSRQNNNRSGLNKEKISVIAAAVFVLSALTLSGIYLSARSDVKNEENRIDFAKLEQDNDTSNESGTDYADTRFVSDKDADTDMYDLSDNNDMDVDPAFTEANSGQVENTRVSEIKADSESTVSEEKSAVSGTDKAAVFMDETPLSFSENDTLVLPIVGDVLIDYSMDEAVYYKTMQQYRYNPSLVVAASEGQTVTAAADARVKDIYNDTYTGKTICFDLGNGYELTYGQLQNIKVNAGDRVSAGDVVGEVAEPTIYYTEEGTNIYYKFTKDQVPINPLNH